MSPNYLRWINMNYYINININPKSPKAILKIAFPTKTISRYTLMVFRHQFESRSPTHRAANFCICLMLTSGALVQPWCWLLDLAIISNDHLCCIRISNQGLKMLTSSLRTRCFIDSSLLAIQEYVMMCFRDIMVLRKWYIMRYVQNIIQFCLRISLPQFGTLHQPQTPGPGMCFCQDT